MKPRQYGRNLHLSQDIYERLYEVADMFETWSPEKLIANDKGTRNELEAVFSHTMRYINEAEGSKYYEKTFMWLWGIHWGIREQLSEDSEHVCTLPHIWLRMEYSLANRVIPAAFERWQYFINEIDTTVPYNHQLIKLKLKQIYHAETLDTLEKVHNQAQQRMLLRHRGRHEREQIREHIRITKQQEFIKENPQWGLW